MPWTSSPSDLSPQWLLVECAGIIVDRWMDTDPDEDLFGLGIFGGRDLKLQGALTIARNDARSFLSGVDNRATYEVSVGLGHT